MERERVTVQEAARQLGITESAIRKRVQRGLLEHDKEPDGRLYVYLDTQDKDRDEVQDSSYDMLVRRLENENEFLRRELERKDAILLNMTEAMKAISPPPQAESPEPRESPQTTDEEPDRAESPSRSRAGLWRAQNPGLVTEAPRHNPEDGWSRRTHSPFGITWWGWHCQVYG